MLQIRPDLVWKPAFPEWSGWHTNYSLFLAIACSVWMSFWKLLTRSMHHPEEPGLHTARSTHKVFFAGAGQTTSCKYGQGIIVVSTTAATRMKFIPQIINREENSSKCLVIVFEKNTLPFCCFSQCNLIEYSCYLVIIVKRGLSLDLFKSHAAVLDVWSSPFIQKLS